MPGQTRGNQKDQTSGTETETTTVQAGGEDNSARQAQVEPAGTETESALEQLREAAAGTWWQLGNVDECLVLRLIGRLSPGEKATVRGDHTLMGQLAGALNESEMVLAVNQLGLSLVWKAYWIEISGESTDAAWSILMSGTSVQERIDLVEWSSFGMVSDDIGGTPLTMFSDVLGTGEWDTALATSTPLMKWLCEALTAAEVIEEIAATGDIPKSVANCKAAGKWNSVVAALPIGGDLQGTTRIALRDIADEVGLADTNKLFAKRFNVVVEGRFEDSAGDAAAATDAGATEINWGKADLLGVWDILENLPDQDVADNTVLRAFQAISGTGAFYSGPDSNTANSGLIQIGQGLDTTGDPHDLAHAVLHEVGHAVHARLTGTVNAWLQKSIGFWFYADKATGVDALITAMGGFPGTYKDYSNNDTAFGDTEKGEIKTMLEAHIGSSSWAPANAVPDTSIVTPTEGAMGPASPDQHLALLWMAMPEKLRTCADLSDDPWYDSYTTLPTGSKGRYFFNHWYSQVFYFSDAAKAAIDATGDTYTAMSHFEFFANCYAEYFGDPAGYADNTKWGGSLNAPVKTFFKNQILDRQPYTPPEVSGGSGDTKPAESTQGASATAT